MPVIAVIFEVWPKAEHKQEYLDLAAELRPILETIDGFISIERFESLTEKGKILSLSFFRDEEAVAAWRNIPQHRRTQSKGRATIFENYRLRIAGVIRDYGMNDRLQAPKDSRALHHAH
jgi:heme-degrading monooxygenase HmoA